MVEEWSGDGSVWGTPASSHGEPYKAVGKMTSPRAYIGDPSGSHSSLRGNTRRAIDSHEATIDEKALKALIRAAGTEHSVRDTAGPSLRKRPKIA